ncbi:GMP reductase [Lentilactobacillus buchneri]|uniref:GMP reductase n=2 Tax=Lentilactobacillus buchneri TaxID=1581 RepID=J9VZ36_LENBU|nr:MULTISPECIES: GMP reductase [Lentilactobacillus]MCC6101324.1 GMP reductase [Lactobacillus sp.]AEB72776.1 GMP reductase [Lentilactobacillus buchneri NRRL B-30929]AFR99642.1 guanosine 5'-monophosphate oxidoreductase [Lentilactobacillus buchneri subsp. silagei CD034]KRK68075.1 GMP reductase [Lentilactobacillus buchneri DSM 20057]MCT2882076.1 GMP reductase [Lentilactobacillus buchneri]
MEVFDYEDIQLIPNKNIIKSRSEADTSVKFGPKTFKIPVVPANMETVIDDDLAVWLAQNGYFYIMHRFQPEKREGFIKMMHSKDLYASISVGIKPEEYEFIDKLVADNEKPEYITIDVAHGHSDYVIQMIHYIKEQLPDSFLIAGNLGTPEAVREIENAGADATKIGVGPGKACITKLKTGFGTGGWQLAALRLCSKAARKPMIADGGIRYNGDIAKSVRFGASMVMIGSLFAGHEETPGNLISIDGKKYKQYWGSASERQKGAYRNVEGRQMLVPYRGHISDTLNEMQQDLQSSISYAGGRKLNDITKVDYVIVKNSIMNGD